MLEVESRENSYMVLEDAEAHLVNDTPEACFRREISLESRKCMTSFTWGRDHMRKSLTSRNVFVRRKQPASEDIFNKLHIFLLGKYQYIDARVGLPSKKKMF